MQNRQVFFNTLQRYFEDVAGSRVDFILQRNRISPLQFFFEIGANQHKANKPSFTKSVSQFPIYGLYPPLSVMFSLGNSRPFELLRTHYLGINSLKAIFQVVYFTLLKKRWLQWVLIPVFVFAIPENGSIEKAKNPLGGMIFGGLGSKVKIFHFDKQKVISILKDGYDERFFTNEISVRENFQHILPIPRLLKSNKEIQYFEEEYIRAVPIRKLDQETWPLVLDLFESLFTYYDRNGIILKSTNEYQKSLINDIKMKASIASVITQERLIEMISILDGKRVNESGGETLIVKGHGDFWIGNILREEDSERLFIVDWERTSRYSLMNDFYTMISIYAIEQGSIEIIERIFNSKSDYDLIKKLIDKYQRHFSINNKRTFLERQLAIFFLERVRFSLGLIVATPYTNSEAEKEIEKWHIFLKHLVKNRIIFG